MLEKQNSYLLSLGYYPCKTNESKTIYWRLTFRFNVCVSVKMIISRFPGYTIEVHQGYVGSTFFYRPPYSLVIHIFYNRVTYHIITLANKNSFRPF